MITIAILTSTFALIVAIDAHAKATSMRVKILDEQHVPVYRPDPDVYVGPIT